MTNLKRYTDAAKLDLMELLTKESPNIFEFRRAGQLCQIMIDLINGVQSSHLTHKAIADAMWEAEDKAPTLHKALGGHIFDGDDLLREKYKYMVEAHSNLKAKYADVLERENLVRGAEDGIALMAQNLDVEQRILAAERQELNALGAGRPAQTPVLSADLPPAGERHTEVDVLQGNAEAQDDGAPWCDKCKAYSVQDTCNANGHNHTALPKTPKKKRFGLF